ncbi:MAG: DUF4860 domain-containing protein [Clostridia bacterium]|nr:DUF4860 domain-containing protein [Clostridia bacterium]
MNRQVALLMASVSRKDSEAVRGGTSTETLMTLLLLIILSLGLISLTASSVGAYQRLDGHKDSISSLRTAQAFVSMKIRQNDRTGCLHIKINSITEENALVIDENISGKAYETWIFSYEGYLRECMVLESEKPSPELSNKISAVDSFRISFDEALSGFRTHYEIVGQQPYESFISIRSD